MNVSWHTFRLHVFFLLFCFILFFCKKRVKNQSSIVMFQPRGSIARAVLHKQATDSKLQSYDKSKWYNLVRKDLILDDVAALYTQMVMDSETEKFLDECCEKSDWIFTQLWHSYVELFLGLILTRTSINGLLGRGSMFVFSTNQFRQLLGLNPDIKLGSLLDLGAGDGATTQRMAPIFHQVSVTEISAPMRWALAKKNFRVLGLNNWTDHRFDVISCLNVLDRCDSPLSIINQMKSALNPGGFLVIAMVLPYLPYVETNKSYAPSERLSLRGATAEEQVNSFMYDVVNPLGLNVIRWTRLPYLSEGDVFQSYYWLDDYVFLLAPES